MASKQLPLSGQMATSSADDFLLVKGIGPAIASRLHRAGIQTYIQLVSLSPAELAERVPGLSARQITRQNWIGQVRKLISKKTRPSNKTKAAPTVRQHYENFTVEFLLDEKNEMRRARVVHVQSGDVDTWTDWKAEQLTDFMIRHAALRQPVSKSPNQKEMAIRKRSLRKTEKRSDLLVTSLSDSALPQIDYHEFMHPPTETATPALPSYADLHLTGNLRLRDLKVCSVDSDVPLPCLWQNQLYRIRLILDLADVTVPSNAPLNYQATVNFTQFGGPCHASCAETGTLVAMGNVALNIAGPSLAPGTYRLDSYVTLVDQEATPGLTAFLKGDLLQVY